MLEYKQQSKRQIKRLQRTVITGFDREGKCINRRHILLPGATSGAPPETDAANSFWREDGRA